MKKSKKKKKIVSSEYLESFREKIEDAFGGHVISLDSSELYEGKFLPTGCFTLDMATCIGGFPYAKVIEVLGENGSGKTTLCLHCSKSIQKKGGFVVYVDVEHDLSARYIEDLGIDPTRFILVQPECAEDALDGIIDMVEKHDGKAPLLIILDSVAALCPRKELEGDMDDQQIALQARLMSKFLRKFRGILGKSENICFIGTNQIRHKIGVRWGDPSVTPGGKALKFYAAMRVKLQHKGFLKNSKSMKYGFRCLLTIIKSKVGIPFRSAEADVVYGKGFDNRRAIVDSAIACGVIKKRGGHYSYKDIDVYGINKFLKAISDKNLSKIRKKVRGYYCG